MKPASLAEVIKVALAYSNSNLHVAMPGIVQAVNLANNTVDVLPQMTLPRVDDKDNVLEEAPPLVHSCPIQFPGGGGYELTFPVAIGDPCLLLFTDRSLAVWLATGKTNPIDPRTHDLSDAVALLGVRTIQAAQAITPPPADRLVLGKPGGLRIEVGPGGIIDVGGGSSEFAALADKVDAALANIVTWATHVHPVTTAPGTTGPASPVLASQAATGSATVKVKG